MTTEKRLYRSENGMLAGICAGIAEYYNMDPTKIRIIALILFFLAGLSFWVYILMWLIVPKKK